MDEMKRTADQGSIQLQGEAQEIALAERLKNLFEEDVIEEIAVGVRGADVKHTVVNGGSECGTILYESKRTKNFSYSWIEKLKIDAGDQNAKICVLVTKALPDSIDKQDKIGYIDGVWICTLSDVNGLSLILRESLISVSKAFTQQSNKDEKMQDLYNYLISDECKLRLSAITDGYSNLQESYNRERNSMERIWKEREKQLGRILRNANQFIGSIHGIAGKSIPDIKQISEPEKLLDE